jgi:hypothetical protein
MSLSFKVLLQASSTYSNFTEIFVREFTNDISRIFRESTPNVPGDTFSASGVFSFSDNHEIVITNKSEGASSAAYRARINEVKSDGARWVTKYSIIENIYEPNFTYLLIEIDSPPHQYSRKPTWPKIPRLLSSLQEHVEFMDHEYPISIKPLSVDAGETKKLYEYLSNTRRRSTALILTLSKFRSQDDFYGELLDFQNAAGLTANTFVLSEGALEELNDFLPEPFAIDSENLRLFNPRVDFSNTFSAHKNRKFAVEELLQGSLEKNRLRVAQIGRDNAINLSVPLSIQNRERSLNLYEQNVLAIGERVILAQKVMGINIGEPFLLTTDSELVTFVKQFLNVESVDKDVLSKIFQESQHFASVVSELKSVQEELYNLQFASMQLKEDLDEEALGKLEEFEQKNKLQAEIRYLRESLLNTKSADLAYSLMPEDDYEPIPLTFSEVLSRIEKLPFVVFTGDPVSAIALDDTDSGSSAAHCWEYLEVLDDYARAKKIGVVDNNLMEYLKNTPNGFKTFSRHKYAPVESEQTVNRPNLMKDRIFPVPFSVSPDGSALMEAHLKLSRRIRLHFLDDSRKTGRVYVGYIGNHLPLTG